MKWRDKFNIKKTANTLAMVPDWFNLAKSRGASETELLKLVEGFCADLEHAKNGKIDPYFVRFLLEDYERWYSINEKAEKR